MKKSVLSLMIALAAVSPFSAHASVIISEAAPWSSGSSPVAADWFELTNTGVSAINITGWSMDDSSATPGVAPLTGVTSIAAGQSVIFIEGNGSANATFINTWFGDSTPTGFIIGNYTGSGIGLSTSGDGVNIFDAANILQTSVSFGASTTGFTFDNAAGLTGTISQLSAIGINGVFVAVNDATEIGSPGTISAVPEPTNLAMLLIGLGLIGVAIRKRQH